MRQIVESVDPLPIPALAAATDIPSLRLYRSDTVRSSDTIDSLFARLGLSDVAAAAFLRRDALFRGQILGRTGRLVTAEANDQQGLEKLTARWTPDSDGSFRRLVVERAANGGFTSRVEAGALQASSRLGSGIISSSLFAAMDDARIPDEVAMQVADILGHRIDFHRELRKGDRFNIVYETLVADGEPMRAGRVLSVEFVNNGKSHSAMWFQEPGKKGGYYGLDGTSLQSAYLGM